jgi:hypothetical protein
MQTIREAKIVIHLESGPANLKAPDLSGFLRQQEQQLDFIKRIADEQERLNRAQASMHMPGASPGGASPVTPSPTSPGSGGAGLPGTDATNEALERQIELTKQLEEATRRLITAMEAAAKVPPRRPGGGEGGGDRTIEIMEEEEQALARLRSSMSALAGAAHQAGEGFFRLARAGVLLGAGNESLEKMVKNLAEVQAYWDVLSGLISIVQAMTNAQKALAAAQGSYILALNASSLATQAFTVVVIEAAAALLTLLAPLVVIGVVIAAVIWAGVAAWDAITESEEEAAESAKQYAEAVQAGVQKSIDAINNQLEMERELEAIKRKGMTLDQQQISLAGSRAGSSEFARSMALRSGTVDPASQKQFLEAAHAAALAAANFAEEELALALKRRDAEIEIRQEKIKQIESAEKALATAQRQQQIEEEKLRTFQAQFGALNQFEQQQLVDIRDRLRRGEELNPFEEDFLATKGGEGGRRAADDIRQKRGAAAGAGLDFWEGTAGAGAVKDMADASDKVAKALEDLAKLLGSANSAAEAKARYEAEIKSINEAHAKEIEAIKGASDQNIKLLELIVERLKELEQALITG